MMMEDDGLEIVQRNLDNVQPTLHRLRPCRGQLTTDGLRGVNTDHTEAVTDRQNQGVTQDL